MRDSLPPREGIESPWLQQGLLGPTDEFMARPSKRVRERLVLLGALIARRGQCSRVGEVVLNVLGEAVETIHAGSLIIDDIQDGSSHRRGRPALHAELGVGLGINAGCWLYFKALRLLENLGFPPEQRLQLLDVFLLALDEGHRGQALDMGARPQGLSRTVVSHICRKTTDLKTGCLVALALKVGAVAEGVRGDELGFYHELGVRAGRVLQALNDVGNLSARVEREKMFEDLRALRPGVAWWMAAERLEDDEFAEFQRDMQTLGSDDELHALLLRWALPQRALQFVGDLEVELWSYLDSQIAETSLNKQIRPEIQFFIDQLRRAYVQESIIS